MIKTFFTLLSRLIFSPKINLNKKRFILVAWPWHLDLNGHVNNAKYLAYCNRARLAFLADSGLLRPLLRSRSKPVIRVAKLKYVSPIRLFERCEVVSQIEEIDKNEVTLTHRILKKGKLKALIQVQIAFIRPQESSLNDFLKELKSEWSKHESTK